MMIIRLALLFALCCLTACTSGPAQVKANKPALIQAVKPPYPVNAFKKRLSGKVQVAYDVDGKGNVINIRVISSRPVGEFDSAAVSTISKWKYEKLKPYKRMITNFDFRISG